MRDAGAGTPRLIVSDFDFAPADRDRLKAALGTTELLLARSRDELRETLTTHPETDVLCSFFPPDDTLTLVPHLAWLALPSAGADHALRAGLVRPGGKPIVTTATGIHAVPIGEFVFSVLLAWTRHWPAMFELQRSHTWPDRAGWRQLAGRELHGATLAVIGLGAIGRHIARLGRAFGMHVIATRRSAVAGMRDPDVDELMPIDRLSVLLAQADFIVVAVPSTPETHHLIGTDELKAVKPGAFLVNIARGNIIDEAALVEALRSGALAGAGLDVFEREPLPAESPLWTMPNVLISPHLAGATERYSARFTDLLLSNLARYRAGEPLRNVVEPGRGY